jgi:integrase/recombinase XerD
VSGRPSEKARLLAAPSAPESLAAWMRRYLEALTIQHLNAANLRARRSNLARFNAWCAECGIARPAEVTHAILARFQRHLFYARKPDGRPYAINGQLSVLNTLQAFFRWMVRHQHLPSNPAADLDLPKKIHYHLREPLNGAEVEAVLAIPDLADPYGLRDRAILELFYATGIRRQELANLDLADIDAERGCLHVRQGKGRKDRFVPVGERALAWVAKYRREARPKLLGDPQQRRLFLNLQGEPLSANALSWRIREYLDRAGVTKVGSCHLFRHTMATAMLDNGADLRHVQEMLGHAAIITTQRYTHVSIAKLKAVHAATHPGARLEPRRHAEDEGEAKA